MKTSVATVVAAVLAASVPGYWKPFPVNSLQPAHRGFGARLAEVAEVFHRTPFLASPDGWVMFPHPTVRREGSLVVGHLMLSASRFQPDGKTVYDTGSAFVLNIGVNDLRCALNGQGFWTKDAAGPMFLEVEPPAGRMHGFPRYQQCVLITHRPGPMFVPVTLERVMALRIAAIEKRVNELRGVVDVAPFDQVVKNLRGRLAKLSPDDRNGPAFATSAEFMEDPMTFDRGRRIVEANPSFFDPARPADIQLLTVFEDCVSDGCPSRDAVEELRVQLDWSALEALVR